MSKLSIKMLELIEAGEQLLEQYQDNVDRGYATTAGGCLLQALAIVKKDGLDAPVTAAFTTPDDIMSFGGFDHPTPEQKEGRFAIYVEMLRHESGYFDKEVEWVVEKSGGLLSRNEEGC